MAQPTTAAVGSRGSIAVGDEVTYGVPVTPTHRLTFSSESISVTENTQQSEEVRDDRAMDKVQRTTLDVSGDISCYIKAAGHGILYRHALGDYVRLQRVDGSIRGRQQQAYLQLTGGTAGTSLGGDHKIVPLADETNVQFDAAGTFALVYRELGSETLVADDNAGAGYAYLDMAIHSCAKVTVADNAFDDGGTTIVAIEVAALYNAEGALENPDFDANGGLLKFGNGQQVLYYFAESLGAGAGVRFYLYNDGVSGLTGDPTTYPSVGEVIDIAATISIASTYTEPDARANRAGVWYMQHQATGWDTVFTHHIEAGRYLPTGLTLEIDRDAAIFVYTGMKVNTMNLNFETGNIASSSFGLVGRREYAMSTLLEPALEGQVSVVIDGTEAVAFPDPASTGLAYHVLTLGERTDIRYTTLTNNGDGTITLGGIPAAGDGSIDRFFKAGTQVDSRTQIRTTSNLRDETICAFITEEIFVYQDGDLEEALQCSITFNNNMQLEKFFLGSPYRAFPVEQTRQVEGTIRYEFDDGKHYHRFKEQIQFPLEIRCIANQGDALIPLSDPPVACSMTGFAANCRYRGGTPNIQSKDQYIEHDMPFDILPDDELNTIEWIMTFVNGSQYDAINT